MNVFKHQGYMFIQMHTTLIDIFGTELLTPDGCEAWEA